MKMKKLFSVICIFSTLLVSSFANAFFSSRFFEVYANVPVDFSNNAFTLNDIFFTPTGQIIIDLEDFQKLPERGFSIDLNTKPVAGFKLDIPKGLVFGANAGAEVSTGLLFSKDFFNFLSEGYNCGEELTLTAKKFNADVFAFAQVDLGWNTKKTSLVFHPALFVPILHVQPDNVSAVLKNTESGEFIVNANADLSVYTNANLAKDGNIDTNSLVSDITSTMMSSAGFDLGVDYKLDLFKFLTVGAGIHAPIVPGKLTKRTSMEYQFEYKIKAEDFINKAENNDSEDQEGTENSTEETQSEEAKTANAPKFNDTVDLGSDVYKINRPFKFYVNGNLHPFGDFLSVYGMLGFTAKHAFEPTMSMSDFSENFYMDYLIGAQLSLIGMLTLDVSTERTNQIYAHKAALGFSLRIVAIDAGVSLASSSFLKTFDAGGVGAFVNVAVGI
ncbi:MAG: hypothetical protein K6A43_01490 [Treponema sp.]|nr:hypothetical protein [Treponema sp.]